jgi:urease accessory protein
MTFASPILPDAVERGLAAASSAIAPAPLMQRARGAAAVSFALRDGRTVLARLAQDGQAKIRLPKVHEGPPIAVIINTAGGVTGGDRFDYAGTWAPGTAAALTSQAAERIYRSTGAPGRIGVRLAVGEGARAEWLPQETIVFDRGRVERRLDVELARGASLLAVETVVLGRSAMGETVGETSVVDHWRVRREGRLAFADSLRLDGDAGRILAGRATGGGASGHGATAFATLLVAGPDMTQGLDRMRALVDDGAAAVDGVEGGASVVADMLVARLVAADARALRDRLVRLLEAWRGVKLPRPWYC